MRRLGLLPRHRIVLVVALLLLPGPVWASNLREDRATLKGIAAIRVVVEKIAADAEKEGLIQSQVQTDVAVRLREAGILVDPASVFVLYVKINTFRHASIPVYAFNIALELWQPVVLVHNPKIAHLATLWSFNSTGLVGTDRVREIRSYVIGNLDTFINAYLEQNPKQ
jgi:hypothetical protein